MDANFQGPPMMPYYQTPYPAPGPAPQPVPPGGRPPQSSISIWAGDLDSYMDETFLRNAVAACGWAADITRIKVVRDRYNGMHAGYGFLDAASPDAAARVLATGSGMPIPGTNRCWRLNMGRNTQGGGGQGGGAAAGTETNVYVGDLEPNVTDFELMSAFRPRFPSTRHAKVVCNDFGQSRGFGFVRFANSAEAERAVQEMNGFEFHGKPIRLSPANGRPKGGSRGYGSGGGPGGMHHGGGMLHGGYGGRDHHGGPTNKRPRQVMAPDDPNNTTLFIGGTGSHVTEDILWREFSIYGDLEAVRVPVNKTGFAFVRFKTREAAQRAKDDLSGTHFISLNPHKPVRLEWASEQIAVTNPPPAAQQMQQQAGQPGSQQPFRAFNSYGQPRGDPSQAVAAQAAAAAAAAAQQAAGNPGSTSGNGVTPGSGAGVDAGADGVVSGPSASPSVAPPGTMGEPDGPPSKRAAVGRSEYSPDGDGPGEQGGDDYSASKGSADAPVSAMPFPWLNSQSAPSNPQ